MPPPPQAKWPTLEKERAGKKEKITKTPLLVNRVGQKPRKQNNRGKITGRPKPKAPSIQVAAAVCGTRIHTYIHTYQVLDTYVKSDYHQTLNSEHMNIQHMGACGLGRGDEAAMKSGRKTVHGDP